MHLTQEETRIPKECHFLAHPVVGRLYTQAGERYSVVLKWRTPGSDRLNPSALQAENVIGPSFVSAV